MTGADDIVGLPETALRSALEFAVGIAAAGQKLRPPLQSPTGLKPLLKMPRLDRAALRAARRAIVADVAFRQRIAGVATAEMVDEVGLAWLQRPAGWEQRVAELLASAKEADEEATAEAKIRRAEKRREAAEHVAARAHAQLLGQQELVAREQVRRTLVEERSASVEAQAARLRKDVARLESDLATVRSRLEAELGRVRAAEEVGIELASRVRDAEQMRDHVLAQRAGEQNRTQAADMVGNQQASAALRQAAEATHQLATALAAAGDALTVRPPAASEPRSIRASSRKRSPIPIPGGIYGDSVAATMHLLQTPNTVVLVDGYNVAKLAWPHLQLIEQRECCIDMLEDLVRRTGADIAVIFDGADVVGASTARRRIIRVHYSPAGVSADDVVRAEVAALAPSTHVVVVTNDQAIVTDVRGGGCNTVSSDSLLAVTGRSRGSSAAGSAASGPA